MWVFHPTELYAVYKTRKAPAPCNPAQEMSTMTFMLQFTCAKIRSSRFMFVKIAPQNHTFWSHRKLERDLVELCQSVTGVASRQHLQSATRQLLVLPRHQLSSYGRQAFCVGGHSGQSVWNSPPDSLRDPVIGGNSFRQSTKSFLFATYSCIQPIRGFTTMHYINRHFAYLLPAILISSLVL